MKLKTIQVVPKAEIVRLLKAKLAEFGENQTQAASALGIKQSTVSNVLRGNYRAGPQLLAVLGLEAKRVVVHKRKKRLEDSAAEA